MGNMNQIVVDTPLKIKSVSGDTKLRLGDVDQGGIHVVENYDYNPLINHPRIEGNELIGDKTYSELGLDDITPQEIDEIIFGG